MYFNASFKKSISIKMNIISEKGNKDKNFKQLHISLAEAITFMLNSNIE